MTEPYYGRCDTCASKLGSRYHVFCRHVERIDYDVAAGGAALSMFAHVLHADHLTQYCGTECAEVGGYCQLNDRGIPFGMVADGPIAPCSKCGVPMDLTQAHITYELMEQTEIRQPWLTSFEPHDAQTIARLCKNCDADLSVDMAETEVDAACPSDDTEHAIEMELTVMRSAG